MYVAPYTEFEMHGYSAIRRRYPARLGWELEVQYRPPRLAAAFDYYAFRGNDRAVWDAKRVVRLTHRDLDKLLEDAAHVRAIECGCLLPSGADMSDSVYARLDEERVGLIWIRKWRVEWRR